VDLSVLDLFILSLLDRDLKTPYDLYSQTGMSLGASVPALQRLKKRRLIQRQESQGSGKRRRHCYELTEIGKEQARRGWKTYLSGNKPPTDIDAILRLADIAMHYRSKQTDVTKFLMRAAAEKQALATEAEARLLLPKEKPLSYTAAREVCEAARHRGEADALTRLAEASTATGRRHGVESRRASKSRLPAGQELLIKVPKVDQKG